MFFTEYFPLSSGPVPLTILCYFCQCVQAQIPLDAQLGSGQPVPRPLIFFTPHFYANITLTIPRNTHLVLFAVQSSRFRERSPTFLLDSRCLDHPFATFDFESKPSDRFAVPLVHFARHSAYFCPRLHCLDVKFPDNLARSILLNALHSMSTPPTEPESPPRTVLPPTPPPV